MVSAVAREKKASAVTETAGMLAIFARLIGSNPRQLKGQVG